MSSHTSTELSAEGGLETLGCVLFLLANSNNIVGLLNWLGVDSSLDERQGTSSEHHEKSLAKILQCLAFSQISFKSYLKSPSNKCFLILKNIGYHFTEQHVFMKVVRNKWPYNMELEIIMLKKMTQSQKDKYHMFSLICGI
jgi:hypothetical protein